MKDIQVLFNDYSFVKVQVKDQSTFFELKDYFAFETEGYQFNPRFKYGSWDGKIRLLNNDGTLPIGLVTELIKFANNMDYSIDVDQTIFKQEDLTREQFDNWINGLDIKAGGNKITPHWYQSDAVYTAIKHQRQILNLPTSAGKSLIQCLLARWYLENFTGKVLIIVPTTTLVKQMADDFVDYELFPSQAIQQIGGGKKAGNNSDALITVTTWQSAVKQKPEWFLQFGQLMVDECHLATGTSISKLVQQLRHIPYKYGLSGSLRDGKTNLMQYVGMFGNIFRPVTTKQLMEEGQVTNLKINSIILRYEDQDTIDCKGLEYQKEISYITSHKKRNAWVCKLALKLAKTNDNVFLMFRHKKHGMMLFEALRKHYSNVHYVSGDVSTKERDALKKMAETQQGMIVVASYGVFSTGVSIKNLHHVIFSHPVKSKTCVLQAIGRVLRKHDSKTIATLWDIADNLAVKTKSKTAKKQYSYVNYALKHFMERVKRYASEKFDYTTKIINL